MANIIPGVHSTPLDSTGEWRREWYQFLSALASSQNIPDDLSEQIEGLSARLDKLESESDAERIFLGLGSVQIIGSVISLIGDSDEPAASAYYGSGPDGAKGWWPLADGFTVTGDLTKTVDPATGITLFGLGDVAPSAGGTLKKTAFDGKGRRVQEGAATTDDLPEGAANLYFTDARADARVAVHEAKPDPHPQYTTPAEVSAQIAAESPAGGGVSDHGALTGLGDDDHPHYLTAGRGDARYSPVGHGHSAATTWAAGFMSAADKTKLDGIASGAQVNTVGSVFGRTGAVVAQTGDYTPAQVGAEPAIAAGTTAQYWRGDKSWQTLNKAAVGLPNVDNTADADKPVSTAQAMALATKMSLATPLETTTPTANGIADNGFFNTQNDATLPWSGWNWILSVRHRSPNYGYQFVHRHSTTQWYLRSQNAGTWSGPYRVWHSGDQGAGSGMDADTVDGKHAGEFMPLNPTGITLSAPAGSSRAIVFNSGSSPRFAVLVNSTAESGGNLGSDMVWYRYSDAGALLAAYMIFNRSDGAFTYAGPSIAPAATNTTSLGVPGRVFSQVYAQNTTISTSDARLKTSLRPLTDAEVAAGVEIAETIGIGQWLEKVEEEGDGARLHVWQIAQDVIAIFERHGLDPFAQSFVCHDTWDEEPEQWDDIPGTDAEFDADGNETRPAVPAQRVLTRPYQPAGERYSLRYIELLMFCHAAKVIDDNRRFAKLEARLAALEAAA